MHLVKRYRNARVWRIYLWIITNKGREAYHVCFEPTHIFLQSFHHHDNSSMKMCVNSSTKTMWTENILNFLLADQISFSEKRQRVMEISVKKNQKGKFKRKWGRYVFFRSAFKHSKTMAVFFYHHKYYLKTTYQIIIISFYRQTKSTLRREP